MNFIINHLWVVLFVSQSPWNKWSDHCFQFWNSILELNWIQNSDSFWDTCSSQPSYFTLCKLFFYLLKMGKIILFIASSCSFASSEWSEVFQGSIYHKHDMLPNMYWWESPVSLHLAASVFSLACVLPFLFTIYLFMAALGLRCCERAFSGCGEQGYSVCGVWV